MRIKHRRSWLLPFLLMIGAFHGPAWGQLEPTLAPGGGAASLTAQGPEGLGSDVYAPQWRIVVGSGATTTVASDPKSWTRHLIWIVPLAILLMILLLLMRRTDDE